MKTRIAILGYGNLGKGVELAVGKCADMELVGVFTRRDPASIKTRTGVPVFSESKAPEMKDAIDVLILCGGSATDLPVQTPYYARFFNVVDSFDTHAHIPQHFEAVDEACRESGKIGIISVGWDPGLFSLNRLIGVSVLPDGKNYTFWGRGVSQGHSDAIRRIKGVIDARQYTVPVPETLASVRAGENKEFTAREMHRRECYVVAEEGADKARIEKEIKEMPNYFADYDTTVCFISQEEMNRNHAAMPHGGSVIRSGVSGGGAGHVMEYKLELGSNPEFTAGVLTAYARAAARLYRRGEQGCRTIFDIAPRDIYEGTPEQMRAHLL